jgi:hypothetical protein
MAKNTPINPNLKLSVWPLAESVRQRGQKESEAAHKAGVKSLEHVQKLADRTMQPSRKEK